LNFSLDNQKNINQLIINQYNIKSEDRGRTIS